MTYNTMINGLCKSGKVGYARMVLKELGRTEHASNSVTYTTVMKCCFRYGNFDQGLEIYSCPCLKEGTFQMPSRTLR